MEQRKGNKKTSERVSAPNEKKTEKKNRHKSKMREKEMQVL